MCAAHGVGCLVPWGLWRRDGCSSCLNLLVGFAYPPANWPRLSPLNTRISSASSRKSLVMWSFPPCSRLIFSSSSGPVFNMRSSALIHSQSLAQGLWYHRMACERDRRALFIDQSYESLSVCNQVMLWYNFVWHIVNDAADVVCCLCLCLYYRLIHFLHLMTGNTMDKINHQVLIKSVIII